MMKKVLFTLMLSVVALLFNSHKADEGMFPLSEVHQLDLKKAGLRMAPIDLYNPNGTSLVDAIVRVGGCTGSFVSQDGLIVTNHHCAFGFVAAMSNVKNNYIRDGFLAKDRASEAPARGLVCKITASYADVSDRVLAGTQDATNPVHRLQIIASNIKRITEEENKANPGLQCEVSEMFTGKTYVLFRYQLLKDVRVVYVPARSIGEYGGEKDNWVWPRHSGDFAFLRAYVSPEGKPAEYSLENVPFKPKKVLTINKKGINENDFVFILGYPGRTYRNQPAAFYKYHEQYMLKFVSDLFDWEIAKMEDMSKGSDSLQIKYAGKIKGLANTTKNFKGKLQGFRRIGLTAKKFEQEQKMQEYLEADPNLKKQYGTVMPEINQLYDQIIANAPRNLFFDYIYQVAPTLQMAAALDNYALAYSENTDEAARKQYLRSNLPKLKSTYDKLYSQMDPEFEIAGILKMFGDVHANDGNNKVSAVEAFYKKYPEAADREKAIRELYANTRLKNYKQMSKMFADSSAKLLKLKDGMLHLAHDINLEMNHYDEIDRKREGQLNYLLGRYADAKSVYQQKQFIPDANGTLRFTYGFVRGYSPNDAEYHKPFTTLRGVLEKEDNADYELLQVIKELYAQRDFGDYIHPGLNDLPIDFLYNLDTTGGNSGSPVMDADGNMVGVNFDRAYTATINDYAWNEAYSRSVAVDIRYVLWTLEKVAKANSLLSEMGIQH